MRSHPLLSVWFVSAGSLLLLSASPAHAQCSANVSAFDGVGVVRENSFHAEIVVTRSGPPAPARSTVQQHPRLVARDSQGRVRTEGITGEFKHDTGPEAGTNAEQHMIRICDPVAQTLTRIDTLNATASIVHSRPSAPPSSTIPHKTFCSVHLPRNHNNSVMAVEDLGTQTIEGVEARGVRMKRAPLAAADPGASSFGETVTERWCSDELSAIVLTVTENTKTGMKSTVAMKNIERTEPDPALFQIPQDYAVTESVAGPHGRLAPIPPAAVSPDSNSP